MNPVDILESWLKSIDPEKDDVELANKRINICLDCDKKQKGFVNNLFVCGECHCPIIYKNKPIGKAYSTKSTCPLGKWEKTTNDV